MQPVSLPPNQVHRFYRGGHALAAFRGIPFEDAYSPEEWVGSTATVFGAGGVGLARLPDGRTVKEAIAADPDGYLGEEHARRFGPDPALLVKLLDAGERLPVHFHPDREFARRELGSRYGKTEAWVIIEGAGTVYVGFRDDVETQTVASWVERQEAEAMLGALHALPVVPGDSVYVPAGTPHAIGERILVLEVQEPSDLSVLLEWNGFAIDGAAEGHLGLGFERALAGLDRSALTTLEVERLRAGRPAVRSGVDALFPEEADGFFRAERIRSDGSATVPAEFSIVVVLDGGGELVASDGSALPLARGDTVLVPFAAGECRFEGALEAIRCVPPEG